MFKFLLIMFAFFPDGQIKQLKSPVATLEQCQAQAQKLAEDATKAGVIVVGTCVKPQDYVGT